MGGSAAPQRTDITIPLYTPNKHKCLQGIYEFGEVKNEPLRKASKEEEWRHLGNYQSNVGTNRRAFQTIEQTINEDLSFLSTRQVTKQGFLQGYELKILQKMLYVAKHSNLTVQQVRTLQTKVNKT